MEKLSKENFSPISNFSIFKCIYLPCAPNIVAFTVESILSWVAIVGILSQTCSKLCSIEWKCWMFLPKTFRYHFLNYMINIIRLWKILTVLIRLSVHSFASSLAILVTSSEASAIALAQAIKSLWKIQEKNNVFKNFALWFLKFSFSFFVD